MTQLVKNLPVMQETLDSIPGLGASPGEGKGYPLHYPARRIPRTVYSPWGREESDATERLSLHFTSYISLIAMFYLHRWSNVGILTLSYGPNVSCLILHCISAFWRCVLISGSYLLTRSDYSRRVCMYAQSLQSGLTLGNAMDCSPPGPSVHARSNILQARI